MPSAAIGLGVNVSHRSEMRNKEGDLIVSLFTLDDDGSLYSRLSAMYDTERIKYCQRHRPPEVIEWKYRTGEPWPSSSWQLFKEIIRLRNRR